MSTMMLGCSTAVTLVGQSHLVLLLLTVSALSAHKDTVWLNSPSWTVLGPVNVSVQHSSFPYICC